MCIVFLVTMGVSLCAAQAASTLQAYALRGPQDSRAKLYLTVVTNDGSAPPSQLAAVTVSTVGADGQPQDAATFTNVDAPGGQAVVDIGDVPLLTAVNVRVTVGSAASPQALNATTAVSEFAVNPQAVVVPDFEGFGAQMNMHLYTALNDPSRGFVGNTPPMDLPNLEQKVANLHPGLSRIFLSPANYDPENQNRMDSFYKTVALAQQVGARVNITWWFVEHSSNATTTQNLIHQDMQEFADTLVDLIVNHHYTAIKEITIQNEPSTVKWLNQDRDLYKECYQLLDQHLRDAGIRDQVKFVGGDLVVNNQAAWFDYLANNMGDLLDGWSVHIYWEYYQTWYMQDRLQGILNVYNSIPPELRKPLSITEYGVRGIRPYPFPNPYRNGAITNDPAGYYPENDGSHVPVNTTNIAAFEQAWFNMLSANDGFVGFSKWDMYQAEYDFTYQDHNLIGYVFGDLAPGQDRWPLRPAYYMEWLMSNTTGQHWQVLGASGSSANKLITPFRSPAGDLTVFAINPPDWQTYDQFQSSTVTVGNLPRATELNVLVWNADGSGKVTNAGTVNSGGTGTVTVNVPAQSMVALTTVKAVGWSLCRSQGGPCVTAAPAANPQ